MLRKIVTLSQLTFCLLTPYIPAFAAPCDTDAHRAFDFWLGEWRVTTPDGKVAGINRIEQRYGGCVVSERYVTGRGFSGESLNMYDSGRGVWHQTWVDNTGTLLLLEGGIKQGKMVLEGKNRDGDGKITQHRITWTPNKDGSVRQLWESSDEKGHWKTVFDGHYKRH
jgi:hypothetical protein